MSEQTERDIRNAVERILQFKADLAPHENRLRAEVGRRRTENGFGKWSSDFWWLTVRCDALRKVRLLLDQNMTIVHSMGVLSVGRYLFEVTLWLRLLERDRDYGFVYYWELMTTQLRYYEDYLAHLTLEVSYLRDLANKESALQGESVRASLPEMAAGHLSAAGVTEELRKISEQIDDEAARRFTIYAEAAKTNGYGFQAHRVETRAIPEVEAQIGIVKAEQAEFAERVQPEMIRPNAPKAWRKFKWNWREQSAVVGMRDEYDFIYTFASKLLHALPVSITTNQPDLSPDEMLMFLKHTQVRLKDLLKIAAA